MLSRIMPFIGLGMFIVLLACALVFLSYVFVIGTLVGLIVYIITCIRLRWLGWESSKSNPSK